MLCSCKLRSRMLSSGVPDCCVLQELLEQAAPRLCYLEFLRAAQRLAQLMSRAEADLTEEQQQLASRAIVTDVLSRHQVSHSGDVVFKLINTLDKLLICTLQTSCCSLQTTYCILQTTYVLYTLIIVLYKFVTVLP